MTEFLHALGLLEDFSVPALDLLLFPQVDIVFDVNLVLILKLELHSAFTLSECGRLFIAVSNDLIRDAAQQRLILAPEDFARRLQLNERKQRQLDIGSVFFISKMTLQRLCGS